MLRKTFKGKFPFARLQHSIWSHQTNITTSDWNEIKREFIEEVGGVVTLFKHTKTGAELLSVETKDDNKTFGVTFRTPPRDSTGLPHILEHSVLCGSRKYPVKEPFVELLKGSLQTFLNAFTYPDRTCYPVASCNLQDFYNLVDVYLDAVFYPRAINDPRVLQQEGWHFEVDNNKLQYKGVVFNEMKGVYSNPENVHLKNVQETLFPNNIYNNDSGGDPRVIPSLTFEDFRNFHSRYYHPSNARFWFYGDDPVSRRLDLVSEYINNFVPLNPDSDIDPSTSFNVPRRSVFYYAVDPNEDISKKAIVTLHWVLDKTCKPLNISLLVHLLLGTPGSPLYKALIDCGLGSSIMGGDLENDLLFPIFGVGLKDVRKEDADKVVDVILHVLEDRAKNGFTNEEIEATMNTVEFSLREAKLGNKKGLNFMLSALRKWIYNKDPFNALKYLNELEVLKQKLRDGKPVFQELIKEYFLDNNYRLTSISLPDPSLSEKIYQEEQSKLENYKSKLSDKEIEEIQIQSEELKRVQETPDPPEALACIPTLKISNLRTTINTYPINVSTMGFGPNCKLVTHDLDTNGIVYVDVGLDIRCIPESSLSLLPLFSDALKQMGTNTNDFVTLLNKIGRQTGGISTSIVIEEKLNQPDPLAYLFLKGKALPHQVPVMVDIMRDMLFNVKLDNKERMQQILMEELASVENVLLSSGHSVVSSYLDSTITTLGWVQSQMDGVTYYRYLKTLISRVESDWDNVLEELRSIRDKILNRQNVIVNITADQKSLHHTEDTLKHFVGSIPSLDVPVQKWSTINANNKPIFIIPTQVNYVGKGCLMKGHSHGSNMAIIKYLNTTWLWDRVRVSGGAYGAFSGYNELSGVFKCVSYRDPNLIKTLDNFDGISQFLTQTDVDDQSLTKAIIGAIGQVDQPMNTRTMGYTSLMHYLKGISNEYRQTRRDELLSTTPKHFKQFGEKLNEAWKHSKASAIASEQAAQQSISNEIHGPFKLEKLMDSGSS